MKNAWGVADVQRPFNDRSTDAYYTARRAEIREALAPSAPTEWQEDEGEGDSAGGNEIPTSLDYLPDGRKKGPQHHKAFAAETSALTGESKRNINQYRAIGDALGEDALRVTGTTLDKKVELMALAKLPEPERKELIERAVAGGFVTVTKPIGAVFQFVRLLRIRTAL